LKNKHEQICRPTVKKLQFQNEYAYIRKSERSLVGAHAPAPMT